MHATLIQTVLNINNIFESCIVYFVKTELWAPSKGKLKFRGQGKTDILQQEF